MKKNRQSGFSLLELIISLTLSTIVLIGVISMATQVVRNQYGTIKTGEVSAQALAGLDAMNRELENASYILPGTPPTTGGNVISACVNYSSVLAASNLPTGCPGSGTPCGSIDGTALKNFYYCVKASGTPGRFDSLLRYPQAGSYGAGCPATPPGSCGAGTFDTIVANNVSLMDNPVGGTYGFYFYRDNSVGGVDVRFIVGNSTPTLTGAAGTVAMPTPVAYKFDHKSAAAKSFQVTGD